MTADKNIRIVSVIGARPQFIKAAPVEMAMKLHENIVHYSIHTGQHYDANMSQIFFEELGLQEPYANLGAGGGSHATQTAAIMVGLEPLLMEIQPHMLVVYGDTNSTIAAALTAAKLHIPIAHIEAGLRSYNKEMPEEVNRILTDHVSDILFAPTELALNNLKHEGLENVHISGDVMLDMLRIAKNSIAAERPVEYPYYYATLHRPYNTDDGLRLTALLEIMNTLKHKVIFSLHPRTRILMETKYNLALEDYENVSFIQPQGYFENLTYLCNSECLITDSGGMQKEAYFVEKPCITVRSETEWVETLEHGCNTLVWEDLNEIHKALDRPYGPFMEGVYGTGNAAQKMVDCIMEFIEKRSQG